MSNRKISLIRFDITSRCNFYCGHCYYGNHLNKKKDLTYEEITKIIENLTVPGVSAIAFYGGEPLVRNDIEDIIKFCTQKEIDSYIVTNGYLLNEKIGALSENQLKGIAVSIDAATEKTYEKIRGKDRFEIVKSNFKLLSEYRIHHRTINFVITKANIEEVTGIIDLALELGATMINFEILALEGNAAKNKESNFADPSELLDAFDKIVKYISTKNISEEFVNINIVPPKLKEYLNRKYGTNFPIERKFGHILFDILYVNADGKIFPCKSCEPSYSFKEGAYKIGGYDLSSGNLLEALRSKEFSDIFIKMEPSEITKKLVYCSKCKYFIEYCYPCPQSADMISKGIAANCSDFPISELCKIVDSN